MEVHLLQRKKSLETKIPEIKKTLDMVNFLVSNQDSSTPLETHYELNDTLFAKSTINPSETRVVYLWLGANVMLEYPTAEAQTLLDSKLTSAKLSLEQVGEDLEFLRDQITTMEVNTARVYNYDVKLRRARKVEEK
ncbi:Prefoldin alpha-like protein [Phlyctochytrium arcticum]|nr:Prefoldin alpha-like protein [Phlyctochytrium arcticum]